MGSMLDVGWGDVIGYLGDDSRTKSIVLFMESVGDARSFLSAARAVAQTKPIIVIKAGRTAAAAKAAASHTGKLTGSDEVLDAAFRRCGVLRVDTIEQLFAMADVLAKQPRPRGQPFGDRHQRRRASGARGRRARRRRRPSSVDRRVDAGTNRRPIGAVLEPRQSDRHARRRDDPRLCESRRDRRGRPAQRRRSGDVLASSRPGRERGGATNETFAKLPHKPILASWMGGSRRGGGADRLERAGIPTFAFPDDAARIFNFMWRYDANLRALFETPAALPEELAPDRAAVRDVFAEARAEERTVLNAVEAVGLLARVRDSQRPDRSSRRTARAAAAAAESLGFPVAVKLRSDTVLHKTRGRRRSAERSRCRGGDASIRRDRRVGDPRSRRRRVRRRRRPAAWSPPKTAYNLIFGSSADPQFGPVLLFGYGGRSGRDSPRPRARVAAPQRNAGPPNDRRDPSLRALADTRAGAAST